MNPESISARKIDRSLRLCKIYVNRNKYTLFKDLEARVFVPLEKSFEGDVGCVEDFKLLRQSKRSLVNDLSMFAHIECRNRDDQLGLTSKSDRLKKDQIKHP